MPNYNSVTICGHITRDPELRTVGESAIHIVNFTIAVNDGKEPNKKTFFIDCKAWHGTAEEVATKLRKGSACMVTGKLTQESWEDSTTKQNRSKIVVEAYAVAAPMYRVKDSGDKTSTPELPKTQPSKIHNDDVPF